MNHSCALHSVNGHEEHSKRSQKRLAIALVFCILFMFIEMAGGYLSGSLAIMTDAVHLLSGTPSLSMRSYL